MMLLDSGLHLDLALGEYRVEITDRRSIDVDCGLMGVLVVGLILEARP